MCLILDEMEMRLQWEHVDVSDYVQGDVEVVENQTQTVNMKNKKVRLFSIEIVQREITEFARMRLIDPDTKESNTKVLGRNTFFYISMIYFQFFF